ncbi:MAG TPA: hypothetical protein VN622_18405 [Clostridia bacterium]|nr:hypothetical protein [Clostridia bacterium]
MRIEIDLGDHGAYGVEFVGHADGYILFINPIDDTIVRERLADVVSVEPVPD